MAIKDMESLLVKFLCDSANSHDLDELNDWVQDERYARIFKEYVKNPFCNYNFNERNRQEGNKGKAS